MTVNHASVTQFQQHVELKDNRKPTKKRVRPLRAQTGVAFPVRAVVLRGKASFCVEADLAQNSPKNTSPPTVSRSDLSRNHAVEHETMEKTEGYNSAHGLLLPQQVQPNGVPLCASLTSQRTLKRLCFPSFLLFSSE